MKKLKYNNNHPALQEVSHQCKQDDSKLHEVDHLDGVTVDNRDD